MWNTRKYLPIIIRLSPDSAPACFAILPDLVLQGTDSADRPHCSQFGGSIR